MAADRVNQGDLNAQARQRRARNKDMERVTGFKSNSRTSGTGILGRLSLVRRREFAEIEDQAEFVGDLVGFVSQLQKTPSRSVVITVQVPAAYQMDAINMMDASSMGFCMLRMYVVPRAPFMDDEPDDADDADDADYLEDDDLG